MAFKERRKYPRISICDPISCETMDEDGSLLGHNLGTAQNVSQNGVMIETFMPIDGDFVKLSFVDVEKNSVEINGKVIYCHQKETGNFQSGISLQGTHAENVSFVKKLVMSYQRTKMARRNIVHSPKRA